MAEDNLYWIVLDARWLDDENFRKGPAIFFDRIPGQMRPLVTTLIRRSIRKRVHGQGTGRHTADERLALGSHGIARIIWVKSSYFMGSEPTGVDATFSPSWPAFSAPF
jgi:hypothetical protein